MSEVLRGPEHQEKEPPLDLKFYVTDHSADTFDTGNRRALQDLYNDIKKNGVNSVRYDWRWKAVEPARSQFDDSSLVRYAEAPRLMREAGLEPPTIVLSSIPSWAQMLYKKDKPAFFDAYQRYVEKVRDSLITSRQKIERVQVLNEINNPIFTPIAAEDMPRLCDITRGVLHTLYPNIKILGTLVASSLSNALGKVSVGVGALDYLDTHADVIRKFDSIAVDYYPGVWHKTLLRRPMSEKQMFGELALLKSMMERLADMQKKGLIKDYEIGEVGLPTNKPFRSPLRNEDRQRYFYDVFSRALKHLLIDFQTRENKIPLPTRIGLYQAMDEPPKTIGAKIAQAFGWPEYDFGQRRGDLQRKEILRGGRHSSEQDRATQPSQLANIIRYMNTPIEKFVPGEEIDITSPEVQGRLINQIIQALKRPEILDDFRKNLQTMDKLSIELLVEFLEGRDMRSADEGMRLRNMLQQTSMLGSFIRAFASGAGGAFPAAGVADYSVLRARLSRNEAFREMVPKLHEIIDERLAELG